MYNSYDDYLIALGELEDDRQKARDAKADRAEERAESRRQDWE